MKADSLTYKYPFEVRFDKNAIATWAESYPIQYDQELETIITADVKARGYFLQEEFNRLCRWKTPRSQSRVAHEMTNCYEN